MPREVEAIMVMFVVRIPIASMQIIALDTAAFARKDMKATPIGTGILLLTLVLSLSWGYKRKIKEKNHRRNGGGNGWVCKGLSDNTEIAVKKSKVVDQNQI
ncbi:hypothetical protein IFM89_034189 [Coptis chinensis]|uniref:Uncharacterized protein n=1 Tax=Coptis chinensis TaxID=261450 RepID=A0A835LK91_9MAGN|nr:hypothetical protein IFM89_034189 [Coptis chinensis]